MCYKMPYQYFAKEKISRETETYYNLLKRSPLDVRDVNLSAVRRLLKWSAYSVGKGTDGVETAGAGVTCRVSFANL